FQAEDGIRDYKVTGVQTCALPISNPGLHRRAAPRRRRAQGGGAPRRSEGDREAREAERLGVGGEPAGAARGGRRPAARRRDGSKIGRASYRERVEMWGGEGGCEKE